MADIPVFRIVLNVPWPFAEEASLFYQTAFNAIQVNWNVRTFCLVVGNDMITIMLSTYNLQMVDGQLIAVEDTVFLGDAPFSNGTIRLRIYTNNVMEMIVQAQQAGGLVLDGQAVINPNLMRASILDPFGYEWELNSRLMFQVVQQEAAGDN